LRKEFDFLRGTIEKRYIVPEDLKLAFAVLFFHRRI
jgi:hypothetical protein